MRHARGVTTALGAALLGCALLSAAPLAAATPAAAPTRPARQASAAASKAPSPTAAPTTPAPLDVQAGLRAQEAKDRADHRVAELMAQIHAEAKQVADRSAAAELAEQRFDAQLVVQAQARQSAATAQRRVDSARAAYSAAEQTVSAAALAAYENYTGPDSLGVSTIGTLLIADDPSAVLDTDTAHRLLVANQVAVVAQAAQALATLRTAERDRAAAAAAVARETARLTSIRAAAEAALADAHHAVAELTAALTKAKASQQVADAALSSFLGGWSTADPKRATALNVSYAKLALTNKHQKPAPAGPSWTPAMGQTVVERALQYLGTDYAWAGGNADGPTRGVCAAGAAHLDCDYIGFDCSGLALYAWAPYLTMAHFAATQYNSGSVHPAPTQLLPGDLVFWSSDGTAAGIHHVAIYVGAGNVIQAPESGDIVRITPLGEVASGYFGATRPLT